MQREIKSFWISWTHEYHFTPFELHSPWWVSGQSDLGNTICAAVKATNEEQAHIIINQSYDKPPTEIEFRFCEERPNDWAPFSDRFPKADWMQWQHKIEDFK